MLLMCILLMWFLLMWSPKRFYYSVRLGPGTPPNSFIFWVDELWGQTCRVLAERMTSCQDSGLNGSAL